MSRNYNNLLYPDNTADCFRASNSDYIKISSNSNNNQDDQDKKYIYPNKTLLRHEETNYINCERIIK